MTPVQQLQSAEARPSPAASVIAKRHPVSDVYKVNDFNNPLSDPRSGQVYSMIKPFSDPSANPSTDTASLHPHQRRDMYPGALATPVISHASFSPPPPTPNGILSLIDHEQQLKGDAANGTMVVNDRMPDLSQPTTFHVRLQPILLPPILDVAPTHASQRSTTVKNSSLAESSMTQPFSPTNEPISPSNASFTANAAMTPMSPHLLDFIDEQQATEYAQAENTVRFHF